jgi:hypothetical protein
MDMLVPLYSFTKDRKCTLRIVDQGITIRRPMSYEREKVIDWIRLTFSDDGSDWASESGAAIARVPADCHIHVDAASEPPCCRHRWRPCARPVTPTL